MYHLYDTVFVNFNDVKYLWYIGEAADIITFGKSLKKTHDSQMIGMYGNGLKS